MYKTILVPVDLGDRDVARRSIDVAADMAKRYGAEIHVMTVVPSFGYAIVGAGFPKDYEKQVLETARTSLKAFMDECGLEGLSAKGHVAHGTIYDEIMKAADTLQCDLIVMASHRPELKDYLLGPNAARVVRHARQSVFVVRDAG
ncbi:universal stress protein UspA [Zhengella mangrovi]|uniref:Universal stress protein UspA n=1 Tax=Zhengella mangrovi TaxID=1982044 RepID=A0A2G1QLH9_9HYPH|nr:universal stress protein [Zhengella mangrovi]PHP66387.1 universal stress protein UspA [Zhengella mangrovi]